MLGYLNDEITKECIVNSLRARAHYIMYFLLSTRANYRERVNRKDSHFCINI